MPTIRAFRMGHLQRIDEVVNILVTPGICTYSVQIGSVITVSPYAPNLLFLFLGALDLPLLARGLERVLAHENNHAVGASDTCAHPLLPVLVVWLLDGHIDEFKGRPGVKGLSF